MRIKADAFRRHDFPKVSRATIPREGGGETLTPFCIAFEGVPNVPSKAPVRQIAAKVEIVLEEAAEADCAGIPDWADLVFVSVTTLTVRAPTSSECQPRQLQIIDEGKNRASPNGSNRNLRVQELVLVRLTGSAASRLTSRVRLPGFHGLVLEWCVDYAQILMPLAHHPCGLRRLEVYSPLATWYEEAQAQDYKTAEDILLCDFIRSGIFELQRLHIVGGAFSVDRSLHNHLFFAIQTHLKSLRQLRVIASDHFDRQELREIGLCAPNLADLLIRAPADTLLVSHLPLHTFSSHFHNPAGSFIY